MMIQMSCGLSLDAGIPCASRILTAWPIHPLTCAGAPGALGVGPSPRLPAPEMLAVVYTGPLPEPDEPEPDDPGAPPEPAVIGAPPVSANPCAPPLPPASDP